ncbi:MAG TPA: hypothetical protein VGI40_04915 [Pirellulaceae bacterium]|jgi:hypothetical protein
MPPPKSVLPATWDLPAEFRARVGDKVGRQRAMVADDHLLLVLHRPPRANDDERVGRFLWRKPDGSWQSSDLGNGAAVLTRHLDEFTELVEQFGHEEDEAVSIAEYYGVLDGMTPVHRAIRNLHAALQDAREKIPADRDLINARDRAYELERSADLLISDVRNALQFAAARKAEEQAAASHQMAVSAHRLNMLVAFFFPIATLTAIFGTNLTHPLERYIPPPYAFFLVISAGAVLGAVLAAYLISLSRNANPQGTKATRN